MTKTQRASSKPTESELRLLKILWTHGDDSPLSVRQVLEHLDDTVGYTTVLKLLQIMLTKQLVTRDESERTHRYQAAVARNAVEGGMLGDLVHRLFDGSATQLVQAAIGSEDIDAQELGEIERLIRNARRRAQRSESSNRPKAKETSK